MKYLLVSLFDTSSGICTAPLAFRTKDEAMRAYRQAIPRDPVLRQFPDEFSLEVFGEFDNEECYIKSVQRDTICRLSQLYTADPIIAEEVPAQNAGTFPLSQASSEGDKVACFEGSQDQPKRSINLGGFKE